MSMPYNMPVTDEALLCGIIAGDGAIFKAFYLKYYRTIRFYAIRLIGQDPAADEIANDTFIKVWEKKAEFTSFDHLKNFMFIATRHACISLLRKGNTYKKALQDASVIETSYEQVDMEWIHADIIQLTHASIENLPSVEGEIIRLSVLEERSHLEIASELQITPNLVAVKKFRAFTSVRSRLRQLGMFCINL